MLDGLNFMNFTAFQAADFQFAPGLNVIVGENGTGKTHILKLAYACIYVSNENISMSELPTPYKTYYKTAVAKKLITVFKPDELGRLVFRNRQGRQRCEVTCRFRTDYDLSFSFNTGSKSEVTVERASPPTLGKLPVYLPTRELLTVYPGFVSLYETTHLEFDETWRDLCILLGAPLAKGPREKRIKELLIPVEESMGGRVEMTDAGRFYLNVDGVRMEMHLVAEGLRKLAMVARLIATGSLLGNGCLFWDEPEANLNPKVIKLVARTILNLCQHGMQVFIASHSLFLLRELEILSQNKEFREVRSRFFGLHKTDAGVTVQQGDTVDDIGEIDALQQELSQSDRYLDAEVS